jgi:hypothetical protein
MLLVAVFALTFYPLVKAFTLGQIQVWINGLFALALLCWVIGRKGASGALIGFICLVKPHFGLFLLWAALRREWRFAIGCTVVGAVGLATSIAAFGVADHFDYLGVLSYLSQRGEGYYPNQSVNGLLNRLVGIGAPELYGNLVFFPDRFPPFNPLVYAGSLVSGAVILIAALLHRRHDRVIDFATMAVSATMAAPIAWEHHYGVLLPIFAAALASGAHRAAWWCWLGVSFVLTSTFIAAANLLAPTALNIAQSYLFAGSLILLVLLHASGYMPSVPKRA